MGGPYASISAQALVSTGLGDDGSMSVGTGLPTGVGGGNIFAELYVMPLGESLVWNAYGAADATLRYWNSGVMGGLSFSEVGYVLDIAPSGGAGQVVVPGSATPLFVLSQAGALELPHGTLTVARDPAAAGEVATLNYVSNNTVQSFNQRQGQVTLNAADVYQALKLCDPLATQPWVNQAITNSIQNLLYTCPFVNTWNGRQGQVYLMLSDITCVFFQSGQQPISPTPPIGSSDDSIATTAWITQLYAPAPAQSTPPANPTSGQLWWDSTDGNLYVYYTDPTSAQWVSAMADGGGGGAGDFLPLTGGTMLGPLLWTSTGTPQARSAQDRSAELIDVRDYGARGDGTTDDTGAINAAIVAGIAQIAAGNSTVVFLSPGTYRCDGSINLTGIRAYNSGMFVIDAWGATIASHAAGLPAIDAVGSQCIFINGLTITGDVTNTPNYGLQVGVRDLTGNGNAANWRTDGLTILGYFSQAAMLNVGAETGCYVGLRINNAAGDGLRMDGLNHFNLTSAFQTVNVPVDQQMTFNDNLFVGAIIQTTSGFDLWVGGNYGTKFDNGYFSTAGEHNVALYSHSGADSNSYIRLYVHMETVSVTDVFLITGPYATPNLPGFEYVDFAPQASNSLFKLDTTVVQCALLAAKISVGDGVGGWNRVFDAPAQWNWVTGEVSMELNSTKWNLPSNVFAGFFMQGVTASLLGSAPVAGWGTPTGGSRIANFPGASATATETAEALAQLIIDLETRGLLAA